MILCDLPYGTTACAWDVVIPFDSLWAHYKRIIKPNRAILLFGSEPFSSHLRMSNIDDYRYDWYWNKRFGGNFVQARRMPLKSIENVSVFSVGKRLPDYFPILERRATPIKQGGIGTATAIPVKNNPNSHSGRVYTHKYPVTELRYDRELGRTVHPTQKPVPLFEYLIRTYTNPGELVLDNCMGSGTTAIACINTNRNYIGFELDETYYKKSLERINKHKSQISSNNYTSLKDFIV